MSAVVLVVGGLAGSAIGTAVQPDNCATANGTGMELWTAGATGCQKWDLAS